MTPHVCYGITSGIVYLEGSKSHISKELIKEHPSYINRKIKGSTKYRDVIVEPLYHEPLKIRKADDYYAELDAEE